MAVALGFPPPAGWTWDNAVALVRDGQLRDLLRAYGFWNDGISHAAMLDGGSSTQLSWRRITGGQAYHQEFHTVGLDREVTDIVESWTK